MARRVLTDGETAILLFIQEGYGAHNSKEKVFFSLTDEAVMFVRLANGMCPLMANLSNLAARRAEGTISSDDELKMKWLRLKPRQPDPKIQPLIVPKLPAGKVPAAALDKKGL